MLFLLCVCSLASIVSPRTQQPRTANNNKHCINNRSRWLQDLSKHYDCFRVWIGCMWTLKCSGNVYIGHFFSFTMREHGERHHYEFQAGLWLARSVCITSFFNLIGGALTAPSSHTARLSQRHSAVRLSSLEERLKASRKELFDNSYVALISYASRKAFPRNSLLALHWKKFHVTLKVESFAGRNFRDFANFLVVRES